MKSVYLFAYCNLISICTIQRSKFASSSSLKLEKLQIIPSRFSTCMSIRDTSMSFFNVLPKPRGLNGGESRSQIEKNKYRDEQKISYKFLNYDVTLDNLDFVSRDLTMPFDILNYMLMEKRLHICEKDLFEADEKLVIMTKSKLTEIKLQILNRSEKKMSLSNIPNSIAHCLIDVNFIIFRKVLGTLMDILTTWIHAFKNLHYKSETRNQFYNTPKLKRIYIEKLANVLENIFSEGFDLCGKPSYLNFNYRQFQKFLDTFSIAYCGPFNVELNGEKQVALFVLGKLNCLRFFNKNQPLFGIFEFPSLSSKSNFENLPKWFLEPPSINNFEINQVISKFEQMSFI